ncbi:cobalt/nickel transport protein [Rhodoblastus acidophilus]|uniref:DUF4198 domain-containing protein n=1 Tax=Rhodoblastus acidophilus TaxID=1074 RepID=UPI0022242DAA|nr:DUF4198 domain-containing protein [Rhodoblastus acidophilus]MCW2285363.1 cobalt/nickel transport protein [Rhodoblastus acidophilus]MCW2334389.1 cobalt/nickel transport protein [Rhodoblastus acidophilus]
MFRASVAFAALLLAQAPALAHFQEIIPSADVLPEGGEVTLDLTFTHPMERGPVMEMARPKRVGALIDGKPVDLTSALTEKKLEGKTAWTLATKLDKPGAAVFFVEPQPYWEPAEKKWITHMAKVVVDSYASGEGWDKLAGLPVEIEPLTRPTGLWTGSLFRGIVRAKNKPVPFAEIEVEWANDGSVKAPNEAFITQKIKADQNGVFAYALPHAGWWGFAALIDGPAAKAPDGGPAKTELGGLFWVKATDFPATAAASAK